MERYNYARGDIMPIHFTEKQWDETKKNYSLWWEGKLERPLVRTVIGDAYQPDAPAPRAPMPAQGNCNDFSYTPDEVIEAVDYQLSQCEFLGDAYPYMGFNHFGPGVLACFCGARLEVTPSGNVWFFADKEREISEIHVKYNPDSLYARRIKDIYRAGNKKWHGNVVMGMPDLGGVLDVVATLRGTENLLYDLYDEPEEVLRVIQETDEAWRQAYLDFNSVLEECNTGYSDWSMLFSSKPSYIIQCDFCYMLGNDMFRKFVLDSVLRHCRELDNVIYHLDGIGQLQNLDDLLAIPELNAIQWVPGAGQPLGMHWIDVYRKISNAGKGNYLSCTNEDALEIKKELKKGFFCGASFSKERRSEALRFLEQMFS